MSEELEARLTRRADAVDVLARRGSSLDRHDANLDREAADCIRRLREALERIARANTGESGCFYTNRKNIRTARQALETTQ